MAGTTSQSQYNVDRRIARIAQPYDVQEKAIWKASYARLTIAHLLHTDRVMILMVWHIILETNDQTIYS